MFLLLKAADCPPHHMAGHSNLSRYGNHSHSNRTSSLEYYLNNFYVRYECLQQKQISLPACSLCLLQSVLTHMTEFGPCLLSGSENCKTQRSETWNCILPQVRGGGGGCACSVGSLRKNFIHWRTMGEVQKRINSQNCISSFYILFQ
jgi:hypothetical protein